MCTFTGRARGRAHGAAPEREVPQPEQGGQACRQAAAQSRASKRESGPCEDQPPALARRRYGLPGSYRGATAACRVHGADDDHEHEHAGSHSPSRTDTRPLTVPRTRTRPLTPRTRHCTSPGLSAPPPPAPTTWQGATALLEHIKAHVATEAPGTAVPKRVAMQIRVRVRVRVTLTLTLTLTRPPGR